MFGRCIGLSTMNPRILTTRRARCRLVRAEQRRRANADKRSPRETATVAVPFIWPGGVSTPSRAEAVRQPFASRVARTRGAPPKPRTMINQESEKPRSQKGMANVTGRDGYIVRKALAYAISVISALPEERQEESDRDDMEKLLHAMGGAGAGEHALRGARCHMGFEEFFCNPEFEAASKRRIIENLMRMLALGPPPRAEGGEETCAGRGGLEG